MDSTGTTQPKDGPSPFSEIEQRFFEAAAAATRAFVDAKGLSFVNELGERIWYKFDLMFSTSENGDTVFCQPSITVMPTPSLQLEKTSLPDIKLPDDFTLTEERPDKVTITDSNDREIKVKTYVIPAGAQPWQCRGRSCFDMVYTVEGMRAPVKPLVHPTDDVPGYGYSHFYDCINANHFSRSAKA